MKFLKKYAPVAAMLFAAVTVQAQAPAPKPSPSEMRTSVEALQKQNHEDYLHVLHLQALARKQKDAIKLTCVNDKLIQIKAHQDLFETASLQVLAPEGTTEALLQSSFEGTQSEAKEIHRLRSEADVCAGELEMYKQESDVNVERPPDLDDPTDTGDGFDGDHEPDIDVPGFATPWK